jgi:hypothetical protein
MSNYVTYLSERLNERGGVSAILIRPEINHSEICLHMEATATHDIPRYSCCHSPIELAWAKVEQRCNGSNKWVRNSLKNVSSNYQCAIIFGKRSWQARLLSVCEDNVRRVSWKGRHQSDVTDSSIISKRNTEASSDDEENAVMSSADRKWNPSTFQIEKK